MIQVGQHKVRDLAQMRNVKLSIILIPNIVDGEFSEVFISDRVQSAKRFVSAKEGIVEADRVAYVLGILRSNPHITVIWRCFNFEPST